MSRKKCEEKLNQCFIGVSSLFTELKQFVTRRVALLLLRVIDRPEMGHTDKSRVSCECVEAHAVTSVTIHKHAITALMLGTHDTCHPGLTVGHILLVPGLQMAGVTSWRAETEMS